MTLIIGVDCATEASRVGLARAHSDDAGLRIEDVSLGTEPVAQTLVDWCHGHDRALLALDAPLGWPRELGRTLAGHRAGDAIAPDPEHLFNRHTDRVIRREVGKKPLEVGADRIARTAVATLRLLDEIGRALGGPVPLAWDPAFDARVAAIEVYPAATMLARGIRPVGYKKPPDRSRRAAMLDELAAWISWTPRTEAVMLDSADALDAAVCVLAGWDFLSGRAAGPEDHALAEVEGWIWAARS